MEGDKQVVTLSKALDSAAKILSFVNFGAFVVFAALIIRMLIGDLGGQILYLLVAMEVIGLALVILIGYRFLRRATWEEVLILEADRITLKKGYMLGMRTRVFPVAELSKFRFLNKPELSPHPLAGESMDYLGFDTEQKMINEVHGDDLMAFDHRGKVISFGQATASWEYDELAELIFKVSGRDIRG